MMGLFRTTPAPASPAAPGASSRPRKVEALDGGDFIGRDLSRQDFANRTIRNANFDHSTLDGANLMMATFVDCSFNGASLTKASLRRATFESCQFNRAKVDQADARDAMFMPSTPIAQAESGNRQAEPDAPGTEFDEAIFTGSNFAGASLVRAALKDVKALNVNFRDAKMQGAVFDRCEIAGSNFFGARLEGADFSLCPQARSVLPEAALGVVAFHKPMEQAVLDARMQEHERWLASNGQEGERLVLHVVDLTRKIVQGRDLSGAVFRQCRLDEARFRGSRLIAADLRGTSLTSAVFRNCDLRAARIDAKAILKIKLDDSRL